MQEELLADCVTASAHIAAWSNRSGKRSALKYPLQAAATMMPDSDAGNGSATRDAADLRMRLKVYVSPQQALLLRGQPCKADTSRACKALSEASICMAARLRVVVPDLDGCHLAARSDAVINT